MSVFSLYLNGILRIFILLKNVVLAVLYCWPEALTVKFLNTAGLAAVLSFENASIRYKKKHLSAGTVKILAWFLPSPALIPPYLIVLPVFCTVINPTLVSPDVSITSLILKKGMLVFISPPPLIVTVSVISP